jgi:hypothetical protein
LGLPRARSEIREFEMAKKQWRKPELKKIEAGAAEANPGNGGDNPANQKS